MSCCELLMSIDSPSMIMVATDIVVAPEHRYACSGNDACYC